MALPPTPGPPESGECPGDADVAHRSRLVRKGDRLARAILFTVYVLVLLRTAWLSDDAFITLRTLDNLRHGFGLSYNPGERVMGFTHPLWALLVFVPMALGASAYAAAMGVSLTCALLAAVVVARAAATGFLSAAALWFLSLSSAYVDYSTSGLENPLTHLLLALFFMRGMRSKPGDSPLGTFLLAGLVVLNRMDCGLLVLPALLREVLERRSGARLPVSLRPLRRWLGPAALGFSPLAAWLVFAVVYYGFPFPNTAYAKLNLHIPAAAMARQGGWYFLDSLRHDPVTLFLIAAAIVLALRRRSPSSVPAALGMMLYLLYVERIGGDFMSGRFFSAPFLVSVVFLAGEGLAHVSPRASIALVAFTSVLGLAFVPGLFVKEKRERWGKNGIANERLWYGVVTRLTLNLREPTYRQQTFFKQGDRAGRNRQRVAVEGSIGMFGFAAGPGVHVIDTNALTDPLLSRIPFSAGWHFRIGHFHRTVPAGYERTIRDGQNELVDPCLHDYYDLLSPVIHGPIFTAARFRAIASLNSGRYQHLVTEPCPAGYASSRQH